MKTIYFRSKDERKASTSRISKLCKLLAAGGLMAAVIAIVTVPSILQPKTYSQALSAEKQEPSLNDIYQLLQDIQQKLKSNKTVITKVKGYESGIKITDYSLYVAWGSATLHNVTIENTSDTAYKDIKIKATYYTSYGGYNIHSGNQMETVEGILTVTIPPHSKETYFKNGMKLANASSAAMYGGSKDLKVEEAIINKEYVVAAGDTGDTISVADGDTINTISKNESKNPTPESFISR